MWLRWSYRDLRARWLQVAAIALVIGIGSGTFSGLSSVSRWRIASYDASYDALDMYDLRISVAAGEGLDAEALERAVRSIPDVEAIEALEARLVVPTQVDASSAGQTVLVRGRLVGIGVDAGGPEVSRLDATAGRALRPGDAGDPVLALDEHFAQEYELPPTGTVRLAGGVEAEYVGHVLQPEYFIVLGERGDLFAARQFAVMFAPLDWLQRYSDRPGEANEVVLTLRDLDDSEARLDALVAQIDDALAAAFPDSGFEIERQADDRALRLLYDDVEGDQQFYDIFATLILLGAAFAAFNLTVRIVESQRREIGIAMALGQPPAHIARRPLLVGAEVALLGVGFGVVVGLVLNEAMRSLLQGYFPLPVWQTAFQGGIYVRGAILGFAIPMVATVFPVWRAVRVAPIDAIRTSHRTASSGLAPLVRRLPIPGSSATQMPIRNVVRTPRRTLLTALGIGAALTVLVSLVGMIDSMIATIDRADAEIFSDSPDRITVGLDSFALAESATVQGVMSSPLFATAEAELRIGGWITAPGSDEEVETFLSFVDFDSEIWRPTTIDGSLRRDVAGLVIAEKAAADLGVVAGDTVTLRHPLREGLSYRFVETELPVLAVHPNPYRFIAFADITHADLANLDGIVNTVSAAPAAGVTDAQIQRSFFGEEGIASVEGVAASAESIRERIDEAVGVFRVIEGAILLLALLIAYNTSSISVDERRREHATMLAFGLPLRTVVRMATVESVLVGALGTALGIGFGRLLLGWLIEHLIPQTLPEIAIETMLATSTVVTAAALGLIAVALAPLLNIRRLRRMDVPSTLRVVE